MSQPCKYLYLVHPGFQPEASSSDGHEVLAQLREHYADGFTLDQFSIICQQQKAQRGLKPLARGVIRTRLRYQYQIGNLVRMELGSNGSWMMNYLDKDIHFPLESVKQELRKRQAAADLEQEPIPEPAIPAEKFQLIIDPEAAASVGEDFEETLRKIFE